MKMTGARSLSELAHLTIAGAATSSIPNRKTLQLDRCTHSVLRSTRSISETAGESIPRLAALMSFFLGSFRVWPEPSEARYHRRTGNVPDLRHGRIPGDAEWLTPDVRDLSRVDCCFEDGECRQSSP